MPPTLQIRDYTLRHLANHLHAAGHRLLLHRLLVGDRRWLDLKLSRLESPASCAADLELAISGFEDPVATKDLVTLTALHTALHLVTRTAGLYSDLDLATLTWLGRQPEAVGYARLRPGPGERFQGLLTIAQVARRQRQPVGELVSELLEAARSIGESERRDRALGELVQLLADVGDLSTAKSLVEQITDLGWKAGATATVAQYLLVERRQEEARARLSSLAAWVDQIDDMSRRVATRSVLVALRRKLGHVVDVAEVVRQCRQEIELLGDVPEQIGAWVALFSGLTQGGLREDARRVYSAMATAVRGIEVPALRDFALAILVEALAEHGEVGKAVALNRAIEPAWLRMVGRAKIAGALWATGLRTRAKLFFQQLRQRLVQLEAACERDLVLVELAPTLVEVGSHREGLTFARQIENKSRRAMCLIRIASLLAAQVQAPAREAFREARELLDEVAELGEDFVSISSYILALTHLALALHQARERDVARHILGYAETRYERLSASSHGVSDRRAAACQSLVDAWMSVGEERRAQRFARRLKEIRERRASQGVLVYHLLTTGRLDDAQHVVARGGSIGGDAELVAMEKAVIQALVEAGKTAEARALVFKHEESYRRASAAIKNAFRRADKAPQEDRFASEVEAGLADLHATLGSRLGSLDPVAGQDHFDRAEQLCAGIGEPAVQTEVWCGLAVTLAHAGHATACHRTLAKARKVAKRLQNERARDRARAALAIAHVDVGQIETARAYERRIVDKEQRARVQAHRAITVLHQQGPDAAAAVLQTPVNDVPRFTLLTAIANGLWADGRPASALRLLTPCSLDELLYVVGGWVKLGVDCSKRITYDPLQVRLLCQVVRIASWRSAGWRQVYKMLMPIEVKVDPTV